MDLSRGGPYCLWAFEVVKKRGLMRLLIVFSALEWKLTKKEGGDGVVVVVVVEWGSGNK